MKHLIHVIVGILTVYDLTNFMRMAQGSRFNYLDDDSFENIEERDVGPYFETNEVLRQDRRVNRIFKPLCQEILTETLSSAYAPGLLNADAYIFKPHKIRMVNCSRELDLRKLSEVGCWPQNCRERHVDIDIFAKPKSTKENIWQLVTELYSVPVTCECFKIHGK